MEIWLQNKPIWSKRKSAKVSHHENQVLEQAVMSACLKRVPHSLGFPSSEI